MNPFAGILVLPPPVLLAVGSMAGMPARHGARPAVPFVLPGVHLVFGVLPQLVLGWIYFRDELGPGAATHRAADPQARRVSPVAVILDERGRPRRQRCRPGRHPSSRTAKVSIRRGPEPGAGENAGGPAGADPRLHS